MHTKGPWFVGRDEFPNEDNIYGPDNAIVGGAHQSRKEVKANARLIAAAPELLEALLLAKGSVEWMSDATDADPEDLERLEIVNEAIRKAKGE